jgi:hypothetical protein
MVFEVPFATAWSTRSGICAKGNAPSGGRGREVTVVTTCGLNALKAEMIMYNTNVADSIDRFVINVLDLVIQFGYSEAPTALQTAYTRLHVKLPLRRCPSEARGGGMKTEMRTP